MTTRENTLKAKVVKFVQENPGLKRAEYIKHFVEDLGTKPSTASLYHHLYVTQVKKGQKLSLKHPARDSRGRFVKRAA